MTPKRDALPCAERCYMKLYHFQLWQDDGPNGFGKSNEALAVCVAKDAFDAVYKRFADVAIEHTKRLYGALYFATDRVKSCGFSIRCTEDGYTTRFSAFTDNTCCIFGVVIPASCDR